MGDLYLFLPLPLMVWIHCKICNYSFKKKSSCKRVGKVAKYGGKVAKLAVAQALNRLHLKTQALKASRENSKIDD